MRKKFAYLKNESDICGEKWKQTTRKQGNADDVEIKISSQDIPDRHLGDNGG